MADLGSAGEAGEAGWGSGCAKQVQGEALSRLMGSERKSGGEAGGSRPRPGMGQAAGDHGVRQAVKPERVTRMSWEKLGES